MSETVVKTREQIFNDYDSFVKKFEVKKTTDDCYTPTNIYNTIAEYVSQTYGLDRESFVRPFWPGADYQSREYSSGEVVVDNPPFSIMAEIIRYYQERKIPFFLFANAMTLFNSIKPGITAIVTGNTLEFENRAQIAISYLTNLEPETAARTAPDLYKALEKANKENQARTHAQVPKYTYPANVTSAALMQKYATNGIVFRIQWKECQKIRRLDAQREHKKGIFGSGLLLSDRAAADRAAADKKAIEGTIEGYKQRLLAESDHIWQLSEHEKEIIKGLNEGTQQ